MGSMQRHCDEETMNHIIELRKQLREMERQRDNAVDRCMKLDSAMWDLRKKIIMIDKGEEDEERNC